MTRTSPPRRRLGPMVPPPAPTGGRHTPRPYYEDLVPTRLLPLAPVALLRHWKGPDHLQEAIYRITQFLVRYTLR